MNNLFLGIDCGTQGTKALVLDSETGQVLGIGSAPHTLIQGEHGRREQDTEQWIHALAQATAQALDQANVNGQHIRGISVSGQQHGLVLLDAQGQVLRPARTPAALTAAMAVINERREIFFMENSFDKSMVLWLWQLVSNNQPQSILSNSLSFVGCYGNGSANLCDGKNSHKNRVRP